MHEVQAQEFIFVDTHLYTVVFNTRCGHSPVCSDQKSKYPAAASRKEISILDLLFWDPLFWLIKKRQNKQHCTGSQYIHICLFWIIINAGIIFK